MTPLIDKSYIPLPQEKTTNISTKCSMLQIYAF